MTTRKRRPSVRWASVGILAALLAVPSGAVLAPPAGVAPSAAMSTSGPSAVTMPVRPVSFGTQIVGGRQGGTGSLALGLTLADFTGPAARSAPPAARPSAAPLPAIRTPALPRVTTMARPGSASVVAIAFALAQRGLPYVWGGDGPQAGEAGFDCSGLTTAAYDYAGVALPRTAHTQYYEGPHVPAGAPLEPGDLVFYGVPERVHHVGLYLGNGRMINAPTFGRPVRMSFVRYPGDDYLGATRPAAGRDAPGLLHQPDLPVPVPPVPAPEVPPAPTEFMAPPAPDVPQLPAAPPGTPADPTSAAAGSPTLTSPAPAPPASASAEDTGSLNTVASSTPPTGPGATPRAGAAATPPADAATTTDPPTGTATTTTAPADGTTATSPAATATTTAPTGDTTAATTPPVGTTTTTTPPAEAATATTAPAGAASTSAPRAESPSTTTPSAAAPSTKTPASSAPAPETTSRGSTSPTATSTPRPRPRPALAPGTLGLPDGKTLRLVSTQQGRDGFPATPARPGTAALARSGATTVVTLPPDTGTAGLTRGGTIRLTDADGNPDELNVRSQRTVDASTAADLVAAGRQQLLLVLPRDDGEVLVVIAS